MKKAIKSIILSAALGAAGVLGACTQDSPVTVWPNGEKPSDKPVEIERGTFAKGADVSWLTELEAAGYTFSTRDGKEKDLMELLRDDCGVNSIRLRVFVNPERDAEINGWCNIDDVVIKARRAHDLGLRLMIDFHFSDRWADPGQQFIPSAWEGLSLEETKIALADHVTTLLRALERYNIEPEWVQIGNETRTGMMWPLGDYENGDNFAQLVSAGTDAVKAVFPSALTIVHVDCGNQAQLFTRLFGKIEKEGARYDMIGMSLYPDESTWTKDVDDMISTVKLVQQTYKKPVMLCEIGFDYTKPEIADQLMRTVMSKGKAADLKGIFWWEPEAPAERGYKKGCFDNGAPTDALNCFSE